MPQATAPMLPQAPTTAQTPPIRVQAQTHRFQRFCLFATEAAVHRHFCLAPGTALDASSARGDGFQRIVEIGPARHPIDARGWTKTGTFGPPARPRGLCVIDFLGAHPFEPIVARIELAHMLKAQPAPFTRSVETMPAAARSAKFARFFAGWMGAYPPGVFVSSVKLCLAHSF